MREIERENEKEKEKQLRDSILPANGSSHELVLDPSHP